MINPFGKPIDYSIWNGLNSTFRAVGQIAAAPHGPRAFKCGLDALSQNLVEYSMK
jgi:hypothetical protein